MARTDKAMRILSTQLELLRGGKVYKKSYCKKNEVSARTFDRDIVEIRMSLSESFSGQEVKYVRNENYYYLDKPDMIKPLTAIEASFVGNDKNMSGTSKGRICGNGRQYCEGDGIEPPSVT